MYYNNCQSNETRKEKIRMKIGIYNPYFDSMGGGERYTLSLASHWSLSHDVHIFWDDPDILAASEARFNIRLGRVKREANFFRLPIHQKLWKTRSYDCIFVLSDGSIPIHGARKGILHFQVPFKRVSFPMWKRMKYQAIVCNSEYTARNLDSSLPIKRSVIYPPVDVTEFKEGKKSNTILSVGRFNGHYEAKKQGILIDAFRRGIEKKMFEGWSLVFAGSMLSSDKPFLEELKKKAEGLPITFFPNCTFEKMHDLYATSRIYWHAAGFGEHDPEHMEHLGISTVEAMSSGCIPVVFDGGGQKEIVTDGSNGYLWSTVDELLEKTQKASQGNTDIVSNGIRRAEDFSERRFTEAFDGLLLSL